MMNLTRTAPGLKQLAMAMALLAPTSALADWTGGYTGLSFEQLTDGTLNSDDLGGEDIATTADNVIGAFAGYQIQRGDYVFGGELALSQANNLEIANGNLIAGLPGIDSRVIDLKARAGYDLGPAVVYGFAGFTQSTILDGELADILDEDTSTGANYGIGLDYRITDQFSVGGEFIVRDLTLETEAEGEELDFDTTTQTIALRASYNF